MLLFAIQHPYGAMIRMRSTENFIDSIHQSHLDNAQQVYVANTVGGNRAARDVSPVTNFVFEFFLYNSLYSVDWQRSWPDGNLFHHVRELIESDRQDAMEKFCRMRCKEEDSNLLVESFLPLAGLNDLSGAWTQITPDDRVTADLGKKFFERLSRLGNAAADNSLKPTGKTFDLIRNCRYFVYLVRNNIFHGSKSLGQIYEADQARRIGVYDVFLRCLNSLFFLATGRKEHGAGLCQLPIVQSWGDSHVELTMQQIYQLLQFRSLKPEDSTLHWKLFRSNKDVPSLSSKDRRSLFYPSAGKDLLFPLLVGLPYCTDFYFYETRRRARSSECWRNLAEAIRTIGGQDPQRIEREREPCDGNHCLEFNFDSIPRRAWIMHEDNKSFLEIDMPLAFYFHRGDSSEGGAGQPWDSEWLPKLFEKADLKSGFHILTDGIPDGLCDEVAKKCLKLSPPNSHRGRDYFYGVFREGDIVFRDSGGDVSGSNIETSHRSRNSLFDLRY